MMLASLFIGVKPTPEHVAGAAAAWSRWGLQRLDEQKKESE